MVELLILNGADINAKDKANWTPIFMAASEGFFFLQENVASLKNLRIFPNSFVCFFLLRTRENR